MTAEKVSARRSLRAIAGACAAGLPVILGNAALATTPDDSAVPPDAAGIVIVDQRFAVAGGESAWFSVAADRDVDTWTVALLPAVVAVDELDDVLTTSGSRPIIDSVSLTGDGATSELEPSIAITPAVEAPEDEPDQTLSVPGAGLYPVTVVGSSAGTVVAQAVTLIDVSDPAQPAAPVDIAVLAGLTDPGPFADLDDSAAAVADFASAGDLVDEPITWVIPPRTAEEHLAGSTLADSFAGDDLVARPLLDLDPSAMVALGDAEGWTASLLAGEDTLVRAAPLADTRRTVWVSTQPITTPAAQTLRSLGARLLAVPPEVALTWTTEGELPASGLFEVSLGAPLEPLPAVVTTPLGDQLAAPAHGGAAVAAAVALGRLILDQRSAGSTVIVVTPGDGPIVSAVDAIHVLDPETVERFTAFAGEVDGYDVVKLADLVGPIDRSVADAGGEPVTLPGTLMVDLADRSAAIAEARERATTAQSMLVDPSPAERWGRIFDGLLVTSVDEATAERRLAEVNAEIDAVLSAIAPLESSTLTFTGTHSPLPVAVENRSVYDVQVNVIGGSPKVEFVSPDDPTVIAAGTTQSVLLDATALSNGSSSAELTVIAPNGVAVTPPAVMTVRVTRLTGVGQVITVGAVLALGSWWFGHFRRNRRRAAQAQADATGFDAVSPDAAEAHDDER